MAKATVKIARSDRVIVPKSRCSYPHLFEPKAFNDTGEPKYQCTFLLPKEGNAQTVKAIKAAQTAAMDELFGKGIRPQNLEIWGLVDGDTKKTEDGEPDTIAEGNWVISAKNKRKPKVVDAKGIEILDEDEVYGGCYVRGSVQAKAYGTSSKGGVALELVVVQKVGEGEAFGGAAKAAKAAVDELGVYEDEEEFAY